MACVIVVCHLPKEDKKLVVRVEDDPTSQASTSPIYVVDKDAKCRDVEKSSNAVSRSNALYIKCCDRFQIPFHTFEDQGVCIVNST